MKKDLTIQDNPINHSKHLLRRICKSWCLLLVMLLSTMGAKSQDTASAVNPDTITDENFVIASLIVADPGDVLYSRVGHVALHMKCPTHNLDYVFSYEAEPVKGQVARFLAGKLKMGMFAIPFEEYLNIYRPEGRGVREYRLNLPIEVKQNLWRILDNHLMEGANLPYDYLQRGCAHSTLMMLKEGLDTIPIQYGEWPEKFNLTRRELTGLQFTEHPWTWCFLNLIGNGSIDRDCPNEEKVIMPADLVEVLTHATVNGKPLMDADSVQLAPSSRVPHQSSWFTPLLVAIVLLVASVAMFVFRKRWMDYPLLAVQTVLGVASLYLVVCSDLCCTEWSWLLIPFNPLPLIFWHWRHYWALPYAILLAIWSVVMSAYPHQLTDATYIVLAVALMINFFGIFRNNYLQNTNHKIDSIKPQRQGDNI